MRPASPSAKEKAQQVKARLDRCPIPIPTITALSSDVCINRINLQAAFRELYGVTIGEYGRQVKLSKIKELLANRHHTLEHVAEETGYNGAPALIRFFKVMEGISPGVWRKGID
jgi:AraC-like DNA-binding protein